VKNKFTSFFVPEPYIQNSYLPFLCFIRLYSFHERDIRETEYPHGFGRLLSSRVAVLTEEKE